MSADEMPEDSWTELRAGKPALAYIAAYPLLRRIARECGYALALHGSLARDFDLIAVPWTHDAVTPEALVEAICHQSDLRVTVPNKGDRPHGRGSWALQGLTVRNSWVDLSVMPLADDRERLLARVEELERQLRNIEAIGGEALPLYVATYSTVDCPTEDTNASR
ncbi:MAG TPA: hypothetical protein VN602_02180 [Gemmatimonadaceae bacterium]|nr:hypothetical protein [Gemmatimonadaceae bacterium]